MKYAITFIVGFVFMLLLVGFAQIMSDIYRWVLANLTTEQLALGLAAVGGTVAVVVMRLFEPPKSL